MLPPNRSVDTAVKIAHRNGVAIPVLCYNEAAVIGKRIVRLGGARPETMAGIDVSGLGGDVGLIARGATPAIGPNPPAGASIGRGLFRDATAPWRREPRSLLHAARDVAVAVLQRN